MSRGAALAFALSLAACHERTSVTTLTSAAAPAAAPEPTTETSAPPSAPSAPSAPPPVHVEEVEVPDDLPALVVRGVGERRLQMLFLPGMCVHPGGYVEAFQHTAASRGDLVGMQGDVSCGGDGSARRWSSDLEAMDRRIDAAFRASGLGEPRHVVVIGYSQGAERAERLVARWPDKYDRAILIGSPIVPSPRTLGRARAVALMAGTYDMAVGPMRAAVAPLRRASVPATFFEIPGARHGQMGIEPERSMEAALDFVEQS
jgi:predicted esterase